MDDPELVTRLLEPLDPAAALSLVRPKRPTNGIVTESIPADTSH